MPSLILPFPEKPDREYAERIVTPTIEILRAVQDEGYLQESQREGRHLQELRHPEYARLPTGEIALDRHEAVVRMALAFYARYGRSGFTPSLRESNPRQYAFESLLHDTRFSHFMLAEVAHRRVAPDPVPDRDRERIEELVRGLRTAFSGNGLIVEMHNVDPTSEPSPSSAVLIDAWRYYEHVLSSLRELD